MKGVHRGFHLEMGSTRKNQRGRRDCGTYHMGPTILRSAGNAPAIIAKGGFSGLFPDSSAFAFQFALAISSSDTILWCDVQLTKDNVGICVPDIKLDNCTNIATVYAGRKKVYDVNGVRTLGWFSVDYTWTQLNQSVALTQAIYSRPYQFDGMFPILAVDDVVTQFGPPGLWLNIQHDIFYKQHNLSMRSYVFSVSRRVIVNYISTPEVDFLRSIEARFRKSKTKLVFRFLDEDIAEPSTNQTYGLLLKNLTYIKTFASGILVPKHYIWPVTSDNYLQPYTSIIMDAHKAGLEIFAADFANDNIISYNYSYDPLSEYLYFIDNGFFSVDGVLTDYPITPSEAIACFSHVNKSSMDHGSPLIISHNGASGDYPDCTDLAYQNAVKDGADVIDCPVQVTGDGILICMNSNDLLSDTTVTRSPFSSRTSIIPDIKRTPGIYTFNLTLSEIQKSLQPIISAPELDYSLVRNPRYKNKGNFTTLNDFLTFAKDKDLSGILITIEDGKKQHCAQILGYSHIHRRDHGLLYHPIRHSNISLMLLGGNVEPGGSSEGIWDERLNAAFMVEKLGFGVTDAVIKAISSAGYNNKTTPEVMIQSTNSSVLKKFKQQTKYKLVYKIDELVRDAVNSSIEDIKEFADSVAIDTDSIFPETQLFITGQTDIVNEFHKYNLSVYVYVLRNEFVSQPWDFFSDATVQINTFIKGAEVDGIITDFPRTARAYKRNSCRNLGSRMPVFMEPVEAGALLKQIPLASQPPALAPMPVLNVADVVEPPLPPVASKTPPPTRGTTPPPSQQPSYGSRCTASVFISLAMLCGSFLFI
ncbi:Glycerophosphodiester phosphodiesterase GDPDL3 [Cocos nucifera]|uniref:glycerophosphodiester phosphodiesterase n=1 Tax=Cocos nucifera TaxID=13894 RepID=A0A8K0MV34_COCNU|nr:Glycerophosphodiester phosphodiesterase GDPDL3 [Cocos nucifera]